MGPCGRASVGGIVADSNYGAPTGVFAVVPARCGPGLVVGRSAMDVVRVRLGRHEVVYDTLDASADDECADCCAENLCLVAQGLSATGLRDR